jgi:hypothetical protein
MCSSLGHSENIFNKSVEVSIRDKLDNKQFEDNYYTLKGKEYEPILLDYLKHLGINGTQDVISYNDQIMASLDCFDSANNVLVEIKTTSKSKDKYDELINYYTNQVVHQYHCLTTRPTSYILIYNLETKDLDLIPINCEQVLDRESWLGICYLYLDKMKDIEANKNNAKALETLQERELIDDQIKHLTKRKEELTEVVREMFNESTVVGSYKITISTIKKAKPADYIKDNGIILDDAYYAEENRFTIKKLS